MKEKLKKFKQRTATSYELQDSIAHWFFRISGILVLIILLLIFAYLVKNSLNFLMHVHIKDFLFNTRWFPTSFIKQEYGMVAMIVSTIMLTFGATIFSGFIGVVSAIFLSEYFSIRVKNLVRYFVEIFSAIPSVVIGLIGVTIIAPFFKDIFGWDNMFNGYMAAFLVGMMALPTVMSVSLDALERVPKTIRIASMGLGASKWETIYKVVLPSIKSGLFTALMLGMGRAVGETMIVLMIAGNSLQVPFSFSEPMRTLTATIAIEMGEVSQSSLHYSALFTLGLVLFLFTFFINFLVDKVTGKKDAL